MQRTHTQHSTHDDHMQWTHTQHSTPKGGVEYYADRLGTNGCATGDILINTEAKCKVAARIILGWSDAFVGKPFDEDDWSVNTTSSPRGCFRDQNGAWFFNTNSTGKSSWDKSPVCMRAGQVVVVVFF